MTYQGKKNVEIVLMSFAKGSNYMNNFCNLLRCGSDYKDEVA
jgi:hypothetical protein